jgi:hypothetical protein
MNLNYLEEKAKAATSGPWTALFAFGSSDLPCSIVKQTGRTIMVGNVECKDDEYICDVNPDAKNPTNDFRFMATFNPKTVLVLLKEIKAARSFRDAQELSFGDSFLYEEELNAYNQARKETNEL